jgi:hypothetical protein
MVLGEVNRKINSITARIIWRCNSSTMTKAALELLKYMINLDKHKLIGKGLHRECYRHPENKNLCIKVALSENQRETRREKKYYGHLQKRKISWEMIPRYYGEIRTNLGLGSIFDLVLDDDGAVSKTLEYYLVSDAKTNLHVCNVTKALFRLKKYLLEQRVITMTLKPKNIACQKKADGNFRLSIIDNIGTSDFFPFCTYSDFWAKRKIIRKWSKFEKDLAGIYHFNSELKS